MSCVILYNLASDTRLTNTQYRIAVLIDAGVTLRAELAKAANVSAPTVARAIAALVKLGVVSRYLKPGKPSQLFLTGRIMGDTTDCESHITGDVETHITQVSGITSDTATHITADATAVDNSPRVSISTGARAEDNLKYLSNLELYPERLEIASTAVVIADAEFVPVTYLNGSAKGMHGPALSAKLIEFVNSPSLRANDFGLGKTSPLIKAWIDEGSDFDLDILPTVRSICDRQRGKTISSYKYFANAVRDATTTRIALEMQASNPITQEEIDAKRFDRPANEGDYTRRKRSRHIDALFADDADGPPKHLGRLDFSAEK